MFYKAEISRRNPTCFLFLIDQSGSMSDQFGANQNFSKAQGVSDTINRLLQDLCLRCSKGEGIRDYFHVGVIGYRDNNASTAFENIVGDKGMAPISTIASTPLRLEERTKKVSDGAGGIVEQNVKFPVWIEPISEGGTPMCEAFSVAIDMLTDWIQKYPDCFPPVVFNITDGESSDGDPTALAERLMKISSSDGPIHLFNMHVSSNGAKPIELANNETILPDDYARLLYNISSPLTNNMKKLSIASGRQISETARGFAFNADLISLIQLLELGTRASNQR